MSRIRSSLTLLAGCAVALGVGGTAALAADMGLPTKAAPMVAAAPPPLDIHGFVEFDWESTLINPSGQVLNTRGAETVVAGLNWTVYKGGGWINSISIGGLVAADWVDGMQGVWSLFEPTTNGNLFDIAGQLSATVTFLQYWSLNDQFTTVISGAVPGLGSQLAATPWLCGVPGGIAGGCSGFAPLPFNQLRLSLNDSFTGWPLTWNPYVSWYYQFENFGVASVGVTNQTAACFTCGPNRSEFFVGMDPTWSAAKWWGIPLTFKAPTYITVGDANFWVGGQKCLVSLGCNGPAGNFGVFTTGLTAIYDLNKWIPSNYGGWYVKGGFQWYDLINNNLVVSENLSVGCGLTALSGPIDHTPCKTSRSIWVGFVGVGVHF